MLAYLCVMENVKAPKDFNWAKGSWKRARGTLDMQTAEPQNRVHEYPVDEEEDRYTGVHMDTPHQPSLFSVCMNGVYVGRM